MTTEHITLTLLALNLIILVVIGVFLFKSFNSKLNNFTIDNNTKLNAIFSSTKTLYEELQKKIDTELAQLVSAQEKNFSHLQSAVLDNNNSNTSLINQAVVQTSSQLLDETHIIKDKIDQALHDNQQALVALAHLSKDVELS